MISLHRPTGSPGIPSDRKQQEEACGGRLFGASRGFPRRERFIGDEAVAQHARVQIERAADPKVETVLIEPMRPIAQHQAEADGIDHSGSWRERNKWPPTPALLIPAVNPDVHLRHEADQVVSFVIDPDGAVHNRDGIDSSRTQIVSPSQAESESEVPKHPGPMVFLRR